MKQIQLTLETAKQLYKEGGAGKSFALDNYSESELTRKELAKRWNDLEYVDGYYIEKTSNAIRATGLNCCPIDANKNIYKSKKQAESALAMAMLSQLMHEANKGWEPDWSSKDSKYTIIRSGNNVLLSSGHITFRFLSFKSMEIRDEFYENHKRLIKTYFQL